MFEFIIGNIFNIILVGIFISYFVNKLSTKMKEVDQLIHFKLNTPPVTQSTVNFKDCAFAYLTISNLQHIVCIKNDQNKSNDDDGEELRVIGAKRIDNQNKHGTGQ